MKISVPLHISGFWIPYIEPSPLLTGSLGAGLALEPVVNGEVAGSGGVFLNDKEFSIDMFEAISKLTNYKIPSLQIRSPVALGLGYGLSSALSWIFSISSIAQKLGVQESSSELLLKAGKVAHMIEVLNMTGLGDVMAQFVGKGLVIRVKPGPPGIGEARSIKIDERVEIVTASLLRMNTPTMISKLGPKSRICGQVAYTEFLRKESLESFLDSAKFFSECNGMSGAISDEISKALKSFIRKGCLLGYFVKKGLLVSIAESPCTSEISSFLNHSGLEVKVFRPSSKGVRVV